MIIISLVYIFIKKATIKNVILIKLFFSDITLIFDFFFINEWINSDNLNKKSKEQRYAINSKIAFSFEKNENKLYVALFN